MAEKIKKLVEKSLETPTIPITEHRVVLKEKIESLIFNP